MKAREERFGVLIPARIRWDGKWAAASVRNISSRGLMLRTATPPSPGTYVEIQINSGVVAARTVWAAEQSCGLRSQERLNVAALCGTRTGTAVEQSRPAAGVARPGTRLGTNDRSRHLSSLMQYLTLAAVGTGAAFSLGWEVYQVLSAPVNVIEAKLN